MNKRWTEEEIQTLIDNYTTVPKEFLCSNLSNRTWKAIIEKAKKLKLTHPTPKERFWRFVDKKSNDECWNWTRSSNNRGYGLIRINDKAIYTHRFSWEIHFGKVPQNLCVLHKCDNPLCVNPSHLFLGTHQDNSDDMTTKDRQTKGENHGRSKLTKNQVKEIRQLCSEGNFSKRKIAKVFNVSHTTIASIYGNRTWRHLNES